jgi:pyruvate, water dikinase
MNDRVLPIGAILCSALAGCNLESVVSDPGVSAVPARTWTCATGDGDTASFQTTIGCRDDWSRLQGPPLNSSHGQATAVKFLVELETGKLWFVNSQRYTLHWEFAMGVLGEPANSSYTIGAKQYSENPQRRYAMGTLDRYEGPDLWTVQFFPGDDLSQDHLARVFGILSDSTYFGSVLKFLPDNEASAARARAAGLPLTTPEAVYQGQTFQSLNPGEAYGTLVRVGHDTLGDAFLAPRDIVLTDGLVNDLPVVAGVVTTAFQTPLSHINVLSRNRGTPNMALRGAWTDSVFRACEGRLVHLVVTLDGFSLEPATLEKAQAFWDTHGPAQPPALALDTTPGLVGGDDLGREAVSRVGSKAANLGELAKIATRSNGAFQVPEGAFAIPFAAYLDHMRRNGLNPAVESLLTDSSVRTDQARRRSALASLQARIAKAPLDTELLARVTAAILANGRSTRMRFRSSTNAEDMAEFNGAGLYESFTGDPTDPKKPVADAIRKVWASLWGFRAYEERDYYRIDQRRVAMGILVHRGFPDEGANGVAVTRNLYMPDYIGYVINAQVGEVSVVSPPEGVTSEQQIYYPFDDGFLGEPSVEKITSSSLTNGEPVLLPDEVVRLGKALKQVQAWFFQLAYPGASGALWYGMDVEFKFDGADRTLYLKQARALP